MTERVLGHRATPRTWVLVANAARARCFERDADNGALREIDSFVHPDSRRRGTALADDRAGQVRKSAAGTALDPHTDPHDREHLRFASELARYLESAAQGRRYAVLSLLASPPFLGELRSVLGPGTRQALRVSLPLDLTTCQGRELEKRVTAALQAAEAPGSRHAQPG